MPNSKMAGLLLIYYFRGQRYAILDYNMPRTRRYRDTQKKPINQGNTANIRSFRDMIKVLFICHGSTLIERGNP